MNSNTTEILTNMYNTSKQTEVSKTRDMYYQIHIDHGEFQRTSEKITIEFLKIIHCVTY